MQHYVLEQYKSAGRAQIFEYQASIEVTNHRYSIGNDRGKDIKTSPWTKNSSEPDHNEEDLRKTLRRYRRKLARTVVDHWMEKTKSRFLKIKNNRESNDSLEK